eukprot:scaffold1118_cov150-Skeletonema_menzelii.AAC.27
MTINKASMALLLCVATAAAASSGDSVLLRASKSGKELDETTKKVKSMETSKKNVYGRDLQMCSTEGMALTGFTRDGRCVEEQDDVGSHHICIDLASIASTGKNFCDVTEQPDWCEDKMACSDDSEEKCPVQDWCVCQWAFAAYIEKAGGCDAIQEINCEATNIEALIAYKKKKKGGDHNIANALKCLKERCKLDADVDYAIAR